MIAKDWKTSTLTAIVVLIVFAAAIHLPSNLNSFYGEQDAARLVSDALLWLKTGMRTSSISQYRYYTSPGYIWLATQVITLSGLTGIHPALYLNALNMATAVVIVIPAFLFYKGLVGHENAFLSTIILSVIPAFWVAGLYGFPHLPALFFILCALLFYDRFLTNGGLNWKRFLVIALLLTAAILLKADIYLSAITVFSLNIHRRQTSWRQLFIAALLLAVPVILIFMVSAGLLASSPSTVKYLAQWNREFEIYSSDYNFRETVKGVFMSMGVVSIPVFLLALILLMRSKRYSLALLMIVWAALPLLMWASRSGDSSRHHFQISVPIALGLGLFLSSIKGRAYWRYGCLILLLLTNYFYFAPSSSTVRTSGNLAQSSALIKQRVARLHEMAQEYAALDVSKKAIIGSHTNPYAEHDVFYNAESIDRIEIRDISGYGVKEVHYTAHGKQYVSGSIYTVRKENVLPATRALQNEGYKVYSLQYDFEQERERGTRQLTELK